MSLITEESIKSEMLLISERLPMIGWLIPVNFNNGGNSGILIHAAIAFTINLCACTRVLYT